MVKNCDNCAHDAPVKSEACKTCELTKKAWSGEPWSDPSNWKPKAVTNGDRIRAMISTDEGLAKALFDICDSGVQIPFCKGKLECEDLLEDLIISESECMKCMIEWLREPYKEDETNAKETN